VTGALSQARSDSNGVSAGGADYVVGGYGGSTLNPEVLATTNVHHFRVTPRMIGGSRLDLVADFGDRTVCQLWSVPG
jgi:hypothetical protein